MAGQTIREVILDLKIKQEKAQLQAPGAGAAGGGGAAPQQALAEQQAVRVVIRARKDLAGQLQEENRLRQKAINTVIEQANAEAAAEKKAAQAVKQTAQALREKQTAATSAGRAASGGAGAPAPGSFFGMKLGGMENPIFKVTSAVFMVANAPRMIFGQLGELAKQIRADIRGGEDAMENGFEAPFVQFMRDAGFMKPKFEPLKPGGPNPNSPEELLKRELELRQSQLNLTKQLLEEETKILAKEQERMKAGKNEFALMSQLERETALNIAKRISGGAALTEEQSEFVQKHGGLRGMLEPKAIEQFEKSPAAALFRELMKETGQQSRLEKATSAIEMKIGMQNQISFNVDADKLAETINDKFRPLLDKFVKDSLSKAKEELERAQARNFHAENTVF